MNRIKFQEIKQKALSDQIPIIMDDTLEVLEKRFENLKFNRILEIGTAVRIFSNMLFQIFKRKWNNRHNRKRRRKSKDSNRKHKRNGIARKNKSICWRRSRNTSKA